ncbi:hypothetical protein PR048_019922 [Dryococelus australis]|uniref:Uncharacterized protein n=1 Tax=Dryococelus australis TaxID=614101 RepID=A0ABQ9H4U4_9NEOP|nr:hypothetical protein PR048_019922 [Dryococelus australis]
MRQTGNRLKRETFRKFTIKSKKLMIGTGNFADSTKKLRFKNYGSTTLAAGVDALSISSLSPGRFDLYDRNDQYDKYGFHGCYCRYGPCGIAFWCCLVISVGMKAMACSVIWMANPLAHLSQSNTLDTAHLCTALLCDSCVVVYHLACTTNLLVDSVAHLKRMHVQLVNVEQETFRRIGNVQLLLQHIISPRPSVPHYYTATTNVNKSLLCRLPTAMLAGSYFRNVGYNHTARITAVTRAYADSNSAVFCIETEPRFLTEHHWSPIRKLTCGTFQAEGHACSAISRSASLSGYCTGEHRPITSRRDMTLDGAQRRPWSAYSQSHYETILPVGGPPGSTRAFSMRAYTVMFPLCPIPTHSVGRTVQVAKNTTKLSTCLTYADDAFSFYLTHPAGLNTSLHESVGLTTIYLAFHWLLAVVPCASGLCDSGIIQCLAARNDVVLFMTPSGTSAQANRNKHKWDTSWAMTITVSTSVFPKYTNAANTLTAEQRNESRVERFGRIFIKVLRAHEGETRWVWSSTKWKSGETGDPRDNPLNSGISNGLVKAISLSPQPHEMFMGGHKANHCRVLEVGSRVTPVKQLLIYDSSPSSACVAVGYGRSRSSCCLAISQLMGNSWVKEQSGHGKRYEPLVREVGDLYGFERQVCTTIATTKGSYSSEAGTSDCDLIIGRVERERVTVEQGNVCIWNYFPSIVTNFTGRMSLSAPVKIYAGRSSDFFLSDDESSELEPDVKDVVAFIVFVAVPFVVHAADYWQADQILHVIIEQAVYLPGFRAWFDMTGRALVGLLFPEETVSSECYALSSNRSEYRLYCGAAVAERLDCSPPTKANRCHFPAGSIPDFRKWESSQTMPLVSRFLGDLPFTSPLHSSAAPFPPNFTHIGSQDFVVKSRANLSTQQHDTLAIQDGSAVVTLEGAGTMDEDIFVERDVARGDEVPGSSLILIAANFGSGAI